MIGKNGLAGSLLALKIVFDLIPQILLVYLISSLITNNINEGNLEYIFLGIFISFVLKGVFYYFATKVAHEKAYEKLTELRLDIIGHLKKISLRFFKEHNTGELTNIVQHDVEQVEVYLAHGLSGNNGSYASTYHYFHSHDFCGLASCTWYDCRSSTHVFGKSSFTENNG